MLLTPGSYLGVYEILDPLGSGGMGEVYRARDTRLKREVAIKILAPAFSADTDRLSRFQREAEILASLNHPHIAAIHGLEEGGATKALVLELVDGETLTERIARGALTVDEALGIATQIASALDAAHESGVVHRDLKPANIKITRAGVVKILDFGLAKLTEPPIARAHPSGVSHSPTITSPALMTEAGVILGTAAYMSPEQARGVGVDRRTDIWALGCIVFEMLTGVRAFRGDTVSDVIASVLKSEPDYSNLPPVSARLRALIQRSLEKDPRKRWRDAGDLCLEMEQAAMPASSNEDAPIALPGTRSRERAFWVLALLLTAGIAALATWSWGTAAGRGAAAPDIVRFGLTPSSGTSLYTGGWVVPFALSPDGRWFAYTATSQDGQSRLWLRALDADSAQMVAGTERATSPFWSPDSNWVGFQADSQLRRVRVPGGVPETITRLKSYTGSGLSASWGDGAILFPARDGTIVRVPAQGGEPEPVTQLDAGEDERVHSSPQFLSNGKDFLYVATGKTVRLMRQSLQVASPTMVTRLSATTSIGVARGHVFYVENGVLWSQRLDEDAGRFLGDRSRAAGGVPVGGLGTAPFSVSSSVIAYWTQSLVQQSSELRWFDREGNAGTVVSARAVYDGFDTSRSGARLATAEVAENGPSIWVRDLSSGGKFPLRLPPGSTVPLWAPDERHIAFLRTGSLYYADVDGLTDDVIQLTSRSRNQLAQDWTTSGEQLLYEDWNAAGGIDLAIVDIKTTRVERLPLNTDANEFGGRLSPDNHWLLYVTDQSGKPEVWIATYPSGEMKRQLSKAGGTHPAWRKDGREAYFISADGQLVATSLDPGSSGITVGPSTNLFRIPGTIDVMAGSHNMYKPAADGARFLLAVKAEVNDVPPVSVILNWARLLTAR